jgi:transcriptional regulator with XRE-family HTH domain
MREAAKLLGAELRRTREKAHLTVDELAVCVGRSPGAVRAIEAGIVRPTVRYMDRVLEVCGRPEYWMPTTMPPPASR